MIKFDFTDKLHGSIYLCSVHYERMKYAFGKVKSNFPLNVQIYNALNPDDLSYFDQLIFRFSKLQDSMGNRLFPVLLEKLGEDIQGKPFIDLLTTLEKLNLLTNHKEWLILRETRNVVTHEYPFITEEIIEGLNALNKQYNILEAIWLNIQDYSVNRFNLLL